MAAVPPAGGGVVGGLLNGVGGLLGVGGQTETVTSAVTSATTTTTSAAPVTTSTSLTTAPAPAVATTPTVAPATPTTETQLSISLVTPVATTQQTTALTSSTSSTSLLESVSSLISSTSPGLLPATTTSINISSSSLPAALPTTFVTATSSAASTVASAAVPAAVSEQPASITPGLQNAGSSGELQSASDSSGQMKTTIIAIAAPIGSIAILGAAFMFLYKKNLGCFRRFNRARRGSLLDDFDVVQNANYHDKFDPARNY